MGQKMYNVTIQGITKQYPEKIPYSEIVKEYEGNGLSWSDGEALTVDDVQWSIETALKAAKINSIYTAAFANIDSMETQ